MKITFIDGGIKEYPQGSTALKIAADISSSLAKKAVFAKVNEENYDLLRPIVTDSKLEIITREAEESFLVLNHSCSHLLAGAVKKLYPKAAFGVGPAIEEGFYYDINPGEGIKFSEDDFPQIEAEMLKAVNQDYQFIRQEVSKQEALVLFKDDKYKQEIINELESGANITIYRHGEFIDLCRGPHVTYTKQLKHFKLLHVCGAYWRGNSKNEQLQRIYGVCFFSDEV
ncbi:MAG: TGS domain-containing protein, partial [Bacilli bacterium]|nr:TGS domain-containing protein [Bacilli bacterium]